MNRYWVLISCVSILILATPTYAGLFKATVNEIQVYEDRVRVHIGKGYGTCETREGWFGWYTTNERHNDWLSLALTAKASGVKISMYDQQNSCAGPHGAVGVEGVFLPLD